MTIPVPKHNPSFEYYYLHYHADDSCSIKFVTREYILRTYEPSQHALTDDDVIGEFVHEFDAVKL
jgi:hypothetical protein